VKWGTPTGSGGGAGSTELIYRYTVTGADKSSIDTGVDTPDAGSNDWTNGDLLEVWLMGRTDETAFSSSVNMTVNNDTAANYDRSFIATSSGGSPIQGTSIGASAWTLGLTAASATANSPGIVRFTMPGFSGTTFWKIAEAYTGNASDATNGHFQSAPETLVYRSTGAAVARVAITPATAGKKLKIGTEFLIYKRLAS